MHLLKVDSNELPNNDTLRPLRMYLDLVYYLLITWCSAQKHAIFDINQFITLNSMSRSNDFKHVTSSFLGKDWH